MSRTALQRAAARLMTSTSGFFIGVLCIAAFNFYRSSTAPDVPPPVPSRLADTTGLQFGGRFLGDSTARTVLVEFSDFQCPFCAKQREALEAIVRAHPRDIAVRFRHLPLRSIHPFAVDAAIASECAGRQKAFESLHDALYSAQRDIGKTTWTTFARRAGVADTLAFASCIGEAEARDRVRVDERAARSFGLSSTPVLIVGDQVYRGYVDVQQLTKLLGL